MLLTLLCVLEHPKGDNFSAWSPTSEAQLGAIGQISLRVAQNCERYIIFRHFFFNLFYLFFVMNFPTVCIVCLLLELGMYILAYKKTKYADRFIFTHEFAICLHFSTTCIH